MAKQALTGKDMKPSERFRGVVERAALRFGIASNGRDAARLSEKIVGPVAALTPLGLADEYADWRAERMAALRQGKQPSMLGGAPVALAALGVVPGGRGAKKIVEGAEDAARGTKGIIAYHGSPHKFDRFDMSKIGTGEGAQAYGHGLYFAENEAVAKQYRDALGAQSAASYSFRGKPWEKMDEIERDVARAAFMGGSTVANSKPGAGVENAAALVAASYEEAIKNGTADRHGLRPMLEGAIDRIKSGDFTSDAFNLERPGAMYQVRINADPADFLDWDAPLSGQSERVRDAYLGVAEKLNPRTARMLADADISGPSLARTLDGFPVPQGSEFAGLGAMRTPSMLNKAGIPGIKYLDAGSRGAGDGSRNYVVFDDKLIEILKRYAWVPGTAIPAAAMADWQAAGGPAGVQPVLPGPAPSLTISARPSA